MKNKDDIINNIKNLLDKTELNIYLVPIGQAKGHEDFESFKEIKTEIISNRIIISKGNNINDIMGTIANAQFFAGTSLHGNITAASYGVPHIGLDKKIFKLDYYLKYWEKQEGGCVDIKLFSEDIINKINSNYKSDVDLNVLKNKVYDEFKNIKDIICQ